MSEIIKQAAFTFDVMPGDLIELWRKNDGKQDRIFFEDLKRQDTIEIEVTYTIKTK